MENQFGVAQWFEGLLVSRRDVFACRWPGCDSWPRHQFLTSEKVVVKEKRVFNICSIGISPLHQPISELPPKADLVLKIMFWQIHAQDINVLYLSIREGRNSVLNQHFFLNWSCIDLFLDALHRGLKPTCDKANFLNKISKSTCRPGCETSCNI